MERLPLNLQFVRHFERAALLIVSAVIVGLDSDELRMRLGRLEDAVRAAGNFDVYNLYLTARRCMVSLSRALYGFVTLFSSSCSDVDFEFHCNLRLPVVDAETMDAPPAQTSSPLKQKQQTRLEDEAVVLLGGDDFRCVPWAVN
jgi:hypothetical protein